MFGRITVFIPLLLVMISGVTYAAPGDLDTSFNQPHGFVTYDGGIWHDYGYDMAIQPDGKIVVAGRSHTRPRPWDVLVLRYNADGSPDESFGTNGVVTYDGGSIDWGWGMALQSDGKIVVTGFTHIVGSGRRDRDLLLLRYNADGSPDSSFGTNGVVTYDGGSGDEHGRVVAIQSDGKIVVAGVNGTHWYGDVLVFRFNADGSLDKSFGTNGVVTYGDGRKDHAWAVAIQSDGKIVVAGSRGNYPDEDLLVLRYHADGSPDSSFGTNGVFTYDSGGGYDCAESVAIQPDGKIVVAGWGQQLEVLLFRYNADGSLDKSFGTDGVVAYEGENGYCDAVAIQSDGKIVAAGGTNYRNPDEDVWVLRYNADGSPDNSFGTNGVATYDSGSNDEYAEAVALQSDGSIVIAGVSHNGSDKDVLVLRLIGGGNESIPASIDIKPDTLNTKSKGKWITCYIELSESYLVEDINVGTVLLENSIPPEASPTEIGDNDNDGIPDLMVKFDRQELIPLLEVGDAELTIAGELGDGTPFEGSDTIRVIRPGK
ncbi:MAG: hypothetical protein ACYSW7_08445 [Planctomycetota bacterium]|jgi:uncharacterized delta-60 repeat protein